jgi:hypothetical protein
MKGF